MAYIDGKLGDAAQREFEDRLRREPALMREVVELKARELLVSLIARADRAVDRSTFKSEGLARERGATL